MDLNQTEKILTAKKEEYLKKIEAQIGELETRLKLVESKAVYLRDAARAEMDAQLQTLKQKKGELLAKHQQIKSASGEAWEVLKNGFEKAASEMKTAFDQAISKFK